jgi:arginase family enzyme
MDIRNYFDPVDPSLLTAYRGKAEKYFLGEAIAKTTENLTGSNFHDLDILIVSAPFDNGKIVDNQEHIVKRIRDYLYRLALPYRQPAIADLGNLKPATTKRGSFLALRDIIEFCKEMKVTTIVIGGSQDLTAGICEAYGNERFFTLSVADAMFDVKRGIEQFSSENFLTGIFKKLSGLFQFNLIGFQNHLVGKKLIDKYGISGEYLRLGQMRNDFLLVEPALRDSDVLSLDMGVISYGFAPATIQKNPNGFRGEEICRLARLAGLSNRLKVFGLFGICSGEDKDDQTLRLASEIIWYFIEGFGDRTVCSDRLTYKVEVSGLERPMIFLNETETGRWWFEISSLAGEKIVAACSEKDYRKAKNNEIPGRWIKFMQKMDNLSK